MCGLRLREPSILVLVVVCLAGCRHDSPADDRGTGTEPDRGEVVVPAQRATHDTEAGVDGLSVPEPSPGEPVKASMACRPANVWAGGTAELVVAIRVARAHYLHAESAPGGKFTPLGLDVKLPAGMTALKDWEFPPSEAGPGDKRVYRDTIVLKRSVSVEATSPSQILVLTAKLRYQACNEELCWPARTMELSVPVSIRTKPR